MYLYWNRIVCSGFVIAIASALLFTRAVTAQDGTPPFVIPLDDPLAPFLESYNYAVSQGATAEWRKMEGIALDSINGKIYIAMSEIGQGMSNGTGAIAVEENLCGVVYEADLDENFNIGQLRPVVVGGPYDGTNADNPCNVGNIANPDNLAVDANGNLWIGEDSGRHANNTLWMYDGANLKRFATIPKGAEVTGLLIDAQGTLFMNIQHPSSANLYPYNRSLIGVVTGYTAGDAFEALPVPDGDGTRVTQVAAGEYQILGRAGSPIPNSSAGDYFGQWTMADGSNMLCSRPDGNMYLPVNEDGTEGYLFSNYECRPAGVSMLYIRRNGSGVWEVLEGDMIDLMSVNGVWNTCFASVTPWNTGLSSEESPAGVNANWLNSYASMTAYLGHTANPYDYGYTFELTPGSPDAHAAKRYVMGRFSHENSVVMPDGMTVYQSDDGTNRILWKFVADHAGDLSSGTLYAAAVTQIDDANGGVFDLDWIELGSSDDETLYAAIRGLDAQVAEADPALRVNSDADSDDGRCDFLGQGLDNQDCTLREAINAANLRSNPAVILFDGAYTVTAGSRLPAVTSTLTISGTATSTTVFQASACDPVNLPAGCTPAGDRVLEVGAGGDLTLLNLTVRHGYANEGGGILNRGTLRMNNVAVIDNKAAVNGGGIANISATAVLTNSTISGNAAVNGGGIYNDAGSGQWINLTISSNAATSGGGIYNDNASPTLLNITIGDNIASTDLGGGFLNAGGSPTLAGVLMADNDGGDCKQGGGGLHADSSHNLIKDGSNACGLSDGVNNNQIGADPLLESLADNGGPTETMAIPADSPAINSGLPPLIMAASGDAIAAVACPATDQRGLSRPQGAGCDIGAFEVNATPLSATLGWFLAQSQADGHVLISWQTVTESGIAGFHLFAESDDGWRVRLNESLVPSPVIDSLEPIDYSIRVTTEAAIFYLQQITVSGGVEDFGPFAAGIPAGVRIDPDAEEPNAGRRLLLPIIR
ncbi:MAG: DUF839 domain-containing protein [Caldilineaceae bacterium]|nr:DUF839 domain-containing protein [Caldilineaceae bacterium]